MGTQSIAAGFPGAIFVNETTTTQSITGGSFMLNETVPFPIVATRLAGVETVASITAARNVQDEVASGLSLKPAAAVETIAAVSRKVIGLLEETPSLVGSLAARAEIISAMRTAVAANAEFTAAIAFTAGINIDSVGSVVSKARASLELVGAHVVSAGGVLEAIASIFSRYPARLELQVTVVPAIAIGSNSTKDYPNDTMIVLTVAFATLASGAAIDPSSVNLFISDPWGVVTKVSYPGVGGVVHLSTGVFSYSFVPGLPGLWSYKWQGLGAVQATSFDRQFLVHASPLLSP